MSVQPKPIEGPKPIVVAALRAQLAQARRSDPVLAFGVSELDDRLVDGGLSGAALHEFAAESAALSDDAAATLFVAGAAARFAAEPGSNVVWALTRFDLYAPGLEQVGLGPERVLFAQGRKDADVLALAEDALREGSVACIIAEVKRADQTATRRLQLAAIDGQTPLLLYRRHRAREHCPLDQPSAAMTRWRIGCASSAPLPYPGVGRGRWALELVRQRNGNPFSLEVDACDDQGRLALSSPASDRTAGAAEPSSRAA